MCVNEDKILRMKDLIKALTEADIAYYRDDDPVMSDREYDQLTDELLKLEAETGLVISGSPTQKVSGEVLEELTSVRHTKPMLSAKKTNPTYVLLNRAGGYRRGRVVMQQFQVVDIVFDEKQPTPTPSTPVPAPDPDPARNPAPPALVPEDDEEPMPENFGPLAFNWVESHVIDLNEQCNEAVAEGLSEYLIPAQELPVTESWDAICEALIHSDFRGAHCCDEGIIIEIEQ